MSNTLVINRAMSRRALAIIAITVGVLFVALIGIRYAAAVVPTDYGLKEGDTVSAAGSDDPDVYIVNEQGYKRLFLNPVIFGFYGHLGGFANVKSITPATRDAFPTSGLFQLFGDQKVYGVESTGEDTGVLHWVNTSGAQAVADDPNFFKKVFIINQNEFNWYAKGSNYTSVSQVPNYVRTPGVPPVTGALSVSLSPDNPGAKTITQNAQGVEFLKVRFTGTGTVNSVTVKRAGPGETDDFTNVYVYDGATRLVSGKTLSSSTGEVTFISLNVSVSGTKDLTFVGDMAGSVLNEAGNVNYLQLKEVALASGTVSGLPVNGNNVTNSGSSSGEVAVGASGSIGDPNVGQKNVQLAEFKLSANTEAASIKRITMIQGGSVKPQDISNLKLKTGTTEWSGSMTSKGYAVFDLGSGFNIVKGGNAIFQMWGDVGGKTTETIKFYFEYATDILAIGDQYGQGVAVTITNFDSSSGSSVKSLTLKGGVLTLNFVGPTAGNIGTDTSDSVFLRYSMTSAANIEVRKTRLVLCADLNGTGFDNLTTTDDFADFEDIKIVNEDTGAVIVGPVDGSSVSGDDSDSCPSSTDGLYYQFTDAFDIAAGQTLNLKVTADVKTANSTTGTTTELVDGSKVAVVLEGYGTLVSGTTGDVAAMKYSGTNTAVTSADIAPSTDISGPQMTIQESALTLGLAATPGSQTFVKGTTNVDMVGITFNAAQASDLRVTNVTLTGYVDDKLSYSTGYNEGVNSATDLVSIANAVTNVRLIEAESGNTIAGVDKVSNNSLSVRDTGTIKFSFTSTPWTIPAGATKTMLVRVDLTNNPVSASNDYYAFDVVATTDVTALDSSSNTVTVGAGSVTPNGSTSPNKVLTVTDAGSMTVAKAPGNPIKGGVYWGQTNVPFSKFRITATNEGQYIEKLTIAASDSTEAIYAKANVKKVYLTYKNKAGSTLTSEQSFTSGASANFGWSYSGSGTDLRPYVPKGSNLDISVAADMRTKDEGATQYGATAVLFSLDFVDKYNGSHANGFKSVGEGSGAVLGGDAAGVDDVTTSNDMYVYRVYPKIDLVALTSPYLLIGTPDVYKFTITAMGLSDSKLLFTDVAAASGSIKFEVVSSGEYTVGGAAYSTSFEVYDESNVLIDSGTLTAQDARSEQNASLTLDFTDQDVEITGGGSKTLRIVVTNPTVNYSKTSATGRAADYVQVVLRDDAAGLINWVGNSTGSTADEDTASVTGVLRNLPATGPTFQR